MAGQEIFPEGVKLRDLEDFDAHRQEVFDSALNAVNAAFPMSYKGHVLEVQNLSYDSTEPFSPEEQKKGMMSDRYLARRLKGKLVLRKEDTGEELDSKEMVLARVPALTERGTILHNGSDYAVASQSRLLPSLYTRRKADGQLEIHANVKMGTGPSMRIGLHPETAEYRLQVGTTSNVHLYSVLKDLGVSDDELRASWGDDVFERNAAGYDSRALDRVYKQMVRKHLYDEKSPVESKIGEVKAALNRALVHRDSTRMLLPNFFDRKMARTWQPVKTAAAESEVSWEEKILEVRKNAAMGLDGLRLIATFLNKELNAGINVDATYEDLAAAVLQFVGEGSSAADPGLNSGMLELAQMLTSKSAGATDDKWRLKMALAPAVLSGLAWTAPEMFQVTARAEGKVRLEHVKSGMHLDMESCLAPSAVPIDPGLLIVKDAGAFDLAEIQKTARRSKRLLESLQAARQATEPPEEWTPGKAVEDYPKGKFRWNGMTVVLENPKGSIRSGKGWQVKMKNDYGYLAGTKGADGDEVDVFVGPEMHNGLVHVIDQKNKEGDFDEVKCMLGFPSAAAAVKSYHANYSPGWTGFMGVVEMTVEQFKDWLKVADLSKPTKKPKVR